MPEREPKYVRSNDDGRLWQGEVLSDVVQVRQELDTVGTGQDPLLNEIKHPFAIVLSQDCDPEADFSRRTAASGSGTLMPNIFLCQATTVASLKGAVPSGKDIWKRVIQNKDERYHCLETVPSDQEAAGLGVDALGIDFKLFFTVPTDELYKRLTLGMVRRRCRLVSPYLEHFVTRFYHYQCRIALPQDHDVASSPQ